MEPDAWEAADGKRRDLIKHQVDRSNSLRKAKAAIEAMPLSSREAVLREENKRLKHQISIMSGQAARAALSPDGGRDGLAEKSS